MSGVESLRKVVLGVIAFAAILTALNQISALTVSASSDDGNIPENFIKSSGSAAKGWYF